MGKPFTSEDARAAIDKYDKREPAKAEPSDETEWTPKHVAMHQLMRAVASSDVHKAVAAMDGYMSHHERRGDEAPDMDDEPDDDDDDSPE